MLKNMPANTGNLRDGGAVGGGLDPCVGKITWRAWQPNPVFLPGESHGQRSLAGYSPTDSEMTEGTSHAGTVSLVAVPNRHSSIDGGSSLLHTLSSLGSL